MCALPEFCLTYSQLPLYPSTTSKARWPSGLRRCLQESSSGSPKGRGFESHSCQRFSRVRERIHFCARRGQGVGCIVPPKKRRASVGANLLRLFECQVGMDTCVNMHQVWGCRMGQLGIVSRAASGTPDSPEPVLAEDNGRSLGLPRRVWPWGVIYTLLLIVIAVMTVGCLPSVPSVLSRMRFTSRALTPVTSVTSLSASPRCAGLLRRWYWPLLSLRRDFTRRRRASTITAAV